jgi:hypothetical protein
MSDLDRVLGRRSAQINEVTTASAIPPVATVPAFRQAKRPALAKDAEEKRRKHNRLVSGVIGMTGMTEAESTSDTESLFPEDAKESDGLDRLNPGIHVKKPQFKQDDPDSPKDEEEQLLSPRAALVAPDVTPNSMTEIDPSDVPGPKGSTFKAADAATPAPADASAPAAPDNGIGDQDRFTNTMDTLLGRDRTQPTQPPTAMRPPTVESRGISPEAAAAMFNSPTGDALLAHGKPMAEPVVSDGKTIFEAARRFM